MRAKGLFPLCHGETVGVCMDPSVLAVAAELNAPQDKRP
jgi:hypothetical protein